MNDEQRRPRGRPRKNLIDSETAPVQALERGLNLLKILASAREASLTDLALRVGMPPSTAHRLLQTLESHRFAEFDEANQNWMIGVEAYRIGSGFLNRINLVEVAQPIMQELVRKTGETANLAILDDGEVVFVCQIESPNPIRAFFRPGTRSPMHASGAGKALLAQKSKTDVEAILVRRGLQQFTHSTIHEPSELFNELGRIRTRGWSFDDQERYEGMSCLAVPVFGSSKEAIAAISVSGPSARFTEESTAKFAAIVRQSATELTDALGGAPQSPISVSEYGDTSM